MTYDTEYLKKLIPDWIRYFSFYFIFRSIFLFTTIILCFFNIKIMQGENGIETNNIFSLIGLLVSLFVIFKLIVAISFIKVKTWAVDIAILENCISFASILGLFSYMFIMSDNIDFTETGSQIITPIIKLILMIIYMRSLFLMRPHWNTVIKSLTDKSLDNL